MTPIAVAPNVAWAAAAAVFTLVASTIVRLVALRHQPPDIVATRLQSLKTWWVVVGVVVGTALIGRAAIIGLLAVVSLMSLREFGAFPFEPRIEQRLIRASSVVIVAGYTALLLGRTETFAVMLPLLAVMVPSVVAVLSGDVSCFTRQIGRIAFAI